MVFCKAVKSHSKVYVKTWVKKLNFSKVAE